MASRTSKAGITQSAVVKVVKVPEIDTNISLDLLNEAFPAKDSRFMIRKNKNGYRGIKKRKGSRKRIYRATIQVNGVSKSLGSYETPEEAARAYDKAARILYGDAATVNFPE